MKKTLLIMIAIFICFCSTGCKNNNDNQKQNNMNDVTNNKNDGITNNDNDKELNIITIEFDSDGGTPVENIVIGVGEQLTPPQTPTKEGYDFLGWYHNELPFNFTAIPKNNIILKAKWQPKEAKTYEVTFNTNGGSTIEKQIVKENEKIKQPTNPTKSGYKFLYWEYNNKKYDFNSTVTENITLVAKWEKGTTTEKVTYTKYKNADAVGMWHCYTEESIKANKYEKATNVMIGDRIVCSVDFETYASDKVKKLQYTLSYGSGLKLVKSDNISSATKSGNTYSFTLKNPTSVGEVIGEFTFEVIGTTGLTYGIKDIKFTTTDNKNYSTNNSTNSLSSSFPKYRDPESVGMWHCYTEESVKANNFERATNVKIGDRIICTVNFETYAADEVNKLQYTLSYGSGLKLVKEDNISSATKKGNTYTFALTPPTSVGEDIGEFTFEVVGTTGLTYGIKSVKFTTTNKGYYSTNDNINTLSTYSKYKSENAVGVGACYTEASVLANNYVVADKVKVGDRIVCMPSFETYSNDKVKKIQFTLTYGSGLKLVKEKSISSATKNGSTYTFTYSTPTSVGEDLGEFTFEVVSTSNLTYGLKNITFVTSNNGYYYVNDDTNSLKS